MMKNQTYNYHGGEIAVIGIAGRFPGAKNIEQFWDNIINGKESISFFSEEELKSEGVEESLLKNPRFVKAKGIVDDIDLFDADFFDYTPKEAAIMDPQFRIFHECVWTALEDAGYDPFTYKGQIGLYAGAGINADWMMRTLQGVQAGGDSKVLETAVLNMRDYLTTLISYKLNLKGPSMMVQTACSTSMVSIHLAAQALLSGDCHMAVAGGVSIRLPQKSGYLYQEGMIHSPDGHCRVFDDRAEGTVFGDGAGAVVLKTLEDALEDRDHIYAVIKGTAINNDGNLKVGYTAPSTKGQVRAIKTALNIAEVDPETITYLEAHGTGTTLGDPIEIEALKQAFQTKQYGFCRIGSVKSNIGHLNDASGVAGFIKTVLSLQHKLIPPTINFKKPNAKIDFEKSPFIVNTSLVPWEEKNFPRRAGVSSFGIGGTNAHVILEEAPSVQRSFADEPSDQLILLSAKTPAALEKMTTNFAEYLIKNQQINLADVSYTLQRGKHVFPYKKAIVSKDVPELLDIINENRKDKMKLASSQTSSRPVVFLFPGQGTQYVDMGRELYDTVPAFKAELDKCLNLLQQFMRVDPRTVLFTDSKDHDSDLINQTEFTQPLLFSIEYALAKTLIHWGIKPEAMVGHSIGEYTAAAISGVMSLENALEIVAYRGSTLQSLPSGSMLSVELSEADLKNYLEDNVSIAAVNSTSLCVVSGKADTLDALEKRLTVDGHISRKLYTSHAFHSAMMDPIVQPFKDKLLEFCFESPSIPFVSNVTGDWITNAEATNPRYWANHLRGTVRFMDCAKRLQEELNPIFIEVGPGNSLSSFIHKMDQEEQVSAIQLLRHPKEQYSDYRYLLIRLGDMWLQGIPIDWKEIHQVEKRHTVPLPTYPFEKERYWIDKVTEGPDIALSSEFKLVIPNSPKTDNKQNISNYNVDFNATEVVLANMWKDILGINQVNIDTHFFEMGGHSLNATGLISRIHREFGVELTLSDIFKHPTIQTLSGLIERSERNQYTAITPAEVKDVYRLSAAQKRTFLVHQRIGKMTTYNMPMALICYGPMDVKRFEKTFKQLIERHETLRTTFELKDGEPVQKIHREFDFAIEITESDMENLDKEIDDFIRPFDLKVSPLIRVKFVKLDNRKHALLVDMHNIVADGASMNIFIKEFTQLYKGESLPEIKVQYKDYAEWQHAYFQSDMFYKQKQYWIQQLEADVPQLAMPFDFERTEKSFLGKAIKFTIDPKIVKKLEQIGDQYRLTNNVLLFQLYGILLSRYTNQQELMIGSLVAGRRHADIEHTIGMFTNFLPIRLRINQEQSFIDNVLKTKQTLLEAYDHQDYPFNQIVEELCPKTEPNRNPLFDTMLIYHNEYDPNIKMEADGMKFETYEFAKGISKLDMKMDVVKEVTGELKCVLQYNSSLFKSESMQAFVSHFSSLIEKVSDQPQEIMKNIPILSPKEQEEAKKKREKTNKVSNSTLLTVSSTFIANPLAPYIRWWGEQFDLNVEIEFSPYGQVFQELLNKDSLLSRRKKGANLLMIRLEDLMGDASLSEKEKMQHLQQNLFDLLNIIKNIEKHVPYLIGILPLREIFNGQFQKQLERIQKDWIEGLTRIENIHLIDFRQLRETYQLDEVFDYQAEKAAHIPFTENYYAALGTRIARELIAWLKVPFKVAAIDCDHTLWKGVVSEVGVEGIEITKAHQELQKFLKKKQEEGLLLVLCSKNNEEDVWSVFDHHPDMILKKSDFVDHRINWGQKNDNIVELAKELNLSTDRFIFLDDDPAQCLTMNQRLPDVLTLLLPTSTEAIPLFLEHVWAFDHFHVTDEDKKRTERYLAEKERKSALHTAASVEDFLSTLNLKVSLNRIVEEHLPRISQMTARVNQFNMNPAVYDEQWLRQQLNSKGRIGWVVESTDRFSDEGIIGVILAKQAQDTLFIDTFLISCRALGKGIESKVLSGIAKYCRNEQLKYIKFKYVDSGKNQPFKVFMHTHDIHLIDVDEQSMYHIAVKNIPDYSPYIEYYTDKKITLIKQDESDKAAEYEVKRDRLAKSSVYQWDVLYPEKSMHTSYLRALEMNCPEKLQSLLVRKNQKFSLQEVESMTEQEAILMNIWKDILKLDKIGMCQDFFSLGGNSLLAIKMEVEIEKKGWVVDNMNFATEHTIRGLAKCMRRENQHA